VAIQQTLDKIYKVKEIFYTLQGEGAQAGRPAIFCRFSKCNLWNGREDSRKDSVCDFCDTDFVGTDGDNGGRYTANELVAKIASLWPGDAKKQSDSGTNQPYIVCTGGEPLLQLDSALVITMQQAGFEVAVETNGTQPAPAELDWICLSPKADAELVLIECDELKLVYPQPLAMPERFDYISATHRYLQPMADATLDLIASDAHQGLSQTNTQKAVQYCLKHPQWKLSLQTHKMLGIE
jgi:7-carboxy-7-deazaguanine synthase (Cx14CxxC type)